jgi:hypothetical protein
MKSASTRVLRTLVCILLVAAAAPLLAQQTGSIAGKVTDTSGGVLPGVTVEARADVLPGPRATVSGPNGDYRLPALPPGNYRVTFTLSGMQTVTRRAAVRLGQETVAEVTLAVSGREETVVVTAQVSLVDKDSTAIASALSNDEIFSLPVAQEYRDLQKLIPGVQYSEDQTRGPSAGGSGQDNVYQFDGVNVTLPLFGTLSAEPASHDIDQFTVVKGGAKAIDFNRSGGFTTDSVSKSGTSEFHGQLGYQFQSAGMASAQTTGIRSRFDQDNKWLSANLGGPILADKLYFFGSYYRPEKNRQNASNNYGELPDFESTRNEYFGKLTFTPAQSVLLNTSYRDSKRTDTAGDFTANEAPTHGDGSRTRQKIAIGEGSWVIDANSYATFKYTHYEQLGQGRPDFAANVIPSTQSGTRLDLGSLDTQGSLTVPQPIAGQDAYNAFIQPIIDRYGYVQNGRRIGGGIAGYYGEFSDQDFFRDAFQLGYNRTLGTNVVHDLHFGVQWYKDREELVRSSNGWGAISVPGGRSLIAGTGQAAFYTARIQAQGLGAAASIKSDYESLNLEFNDTIKVNDWTFNLGLLASRDTLFGQGLREDAGTLSGYVAAPGKRYKMYEVPFDKMLQPRLGATWAYNGKDTVYASFARYNPAASSLPRAASWDRNLQGTFIDVHFDANGVAFAAVPVGSSSGKLFVPDMTPRRIDEFLVGTARTLGDNWSGRLYYRHRRGSHYWEDTNNNARVVFEPPPGIPRELYIPDLDAQRAQIGSGSSYVIAELDGAYTRYNEVTLEAEWRDEKTFVRGTYTWSEYYGNFDQDNSTTSNDDNIFIGSSFIADGAGRQLWNFKDGTLRGDRPHLLKIYGYRLLPWNASFGLFGVLQSGQPWEEWSVEPYRRFTSSTSDVNRYTEPAGSRRSDTHYQIDLNYTQNIRLSQKARLQLAADLYNVFDKQTGYNITPFRSSSEFGNPRTYYAPRRLQLAARVVF